MKRVIYPIVLYCIAMSSCASIEKLVDQGNYDAAIELATRKLAGKKNKKTKHIRALEEAYAKVNARDLDRITHLQLKDDADSWADVYRIYDRINRRQNSITPYLPLISKDGYHAFFELVHVAEPKVLAAKNAAAKYYESGTALIEIAEASGDKYAARRAYAEFKLSESFDLDNPSLIEDIRYSYDLGTTHILVTVDDQVAAINDWSHSLRLPDRSWTKFYYSGLARDEFDLISKLTLRDAHVSTEQERINNESFVKETEILQDIVRRDGTVATDSLGNTLQETVVEVQRGRTRHIARSKNAQLLGIAEIIDPETGLILALEPIEINVGFVSEGYRIIGDRRAIPSRILGFNSRIDDFPTDYAMIAEGRDDMYDAFSSIVSRHLE